MSNSPMTLSSFKDDLKANKYADATAARRAIGKAKSISEEDKAAGKKAIDAKFPATAAAKTATPAKKTAAPAKKVKASAAAKSATKTPARAKRAKASDAKEGPAALLLEGTMLFSPRVTFAEKAIVSVSHALEVVKTSGVPSEAAIEEMTTTILLATNVFRDELHDMERAAKLATGPASEEAAEAPAPPAKKARAPRAAAAPAPTANGTAVNTSPEGLFRGSAPPAPTA